MQNLWHSSDAKSFVGYVLGTSYITRLFSPVSRLKSSKWETEAEERRRKGKASHVPCIKMNSLWQTNIFIGIFIACRATDSSSSNGIYLWKSWGILNITLQNDITCQWSLMIIKYRHCMVGCTRPKVLLLKHLVWPVLRAGHRSGPRTIQ